MSTTESPYVVYIRREGGETFILKPDASELDYVVYGLWDDERSDWDLRAYPVSGWGGTRSCRHVIFYDALAEESVTLEVDERVVFADSIEYVRRDDVEVDLSKILPAGQ